MNDTYTYLRTRRLFLAVGAAAMMLWLGPLAQAQSLWEGAFGSNWDDASNWYPLGIPGSTAEADFGIASFRRITFSSSSTSVGGLFFQPAAPPYTLTLSSSNTLMINVRSIVNESSQPATFNNAGTLTFNGGTITIIPQPPQPPQARS